MLRVGRGGGELGAGREGGDCHLGHRASPYAPVAPSPSHHIWQVEIRDLLARLPASRLSIATPPCHHIWQVELRAAVAPLASAAEVDAAMQQLISKSAVESVVTSIDKKANVDDINRSLTEVNRELAQRPTLAELNRVIGEQSLIMESLCSEHLLGRWIWKSGRAKGEKNAVPWNVQNINTNPDNFMWEKDRCAITTVAPGLYEVTFGFFTRKKPQVQLLVNGEPVLSAVNSASYAVHHSSGYMCTRMPTCTYMHHYHCLLRRPSLLRVYVYTHAYMYIHAPLRRPSLLRANHRSPLTSHRSPLTAHRSPLTLCLPGG